MRTLILLFLFLFVPIAYGEDNIIWLEPGVGAGPVRIGDSRESVVEKLGLPVKYEGLKIMYNMSYEDFLIEMNASDDLMRRMVNVQKGIENEKKEPEAALLRITSYSPNSKTRGNIGIGSTLPEVLNVFGDTHLKIVRQEPLKAIVCSTADVFKYPENTIASLRKEDYNGYMLEVDYFQEGIQFIFKLDDSLPKVFAITISAKDECRVKADMEAGYIDAH